MKITEVIPHRLDYKVQHPYCNSNGEWIYARPATLIEVKTDNGLIGWGEGGGIPSPSDIETHVIGKDPFDCAVIYDNLSRNSHASACGIEIALWDLMGKALQKPVYKLLGGSRRDSVPAYASGFFKPQKGDHIKHVVEEARRCKDSGFRALKMRIGFGPDQDERIISEIRNAVGEDISLAADVNLGYDVPTAIEAGLRLIPYNLMWYEEPVAANNLDGYCEIKQALPMRIAGAEGRSGLRSFREVVQRHAVDIIQPDICKAGGFTEGQRIWALASANQVRLVPHMFGTVIRLAATLQWLSAIPDEEIALDPLPLFLELDVMENGLRTDLSPTPFDFQDGIM
ncbi:MAG: mandelate racemase/muconate lactonizing enzyme family protein, partial [Candidatus Latescibacteria bacterium]|nr:mandelate racemase/muconate lactonizing enzyme family protein [Candidatus Latescibacterota bacterium]